MVGDLYQTRLFGTVRMAEHARFAFPSPSTASPSI
jgi:hypothetical protein